MKNLMISGRFHVATSWVEKPAKPIDQILGNINLWSTSQAAKMGPLPLNEYWIALGKKEARKEARVFEVGKGLDGSTV